MADQIALEQEMRTLGIERFRDQVQKSKDYGQETEKGAVRRLLGEKAPALVDGIKAFLAGSGTVGRRHAALRYLRPPAIEPETIALITLRAVLDRLHALPTHQKVCGAIAGMIEDELHFRHFAALEKAAVKLAKVIDERRPNLFDRAQDIATKNTSNIKQRRRQMRKAADAAEVVWVDWDERTNMLVGSALIELLIETTGLVFKYQPPNDPGSKLRPPLELHGTDEVLEWIRVENKACEALAPLYLPTVVPPKPWTSPLSGGYYGRAVRSVRLIKGAKREYLEELEGCDLSRVYSALNAVQGTAWAVNASVLNVLLEMVETAERYVDAGQQAPEWFPLPRLDKMPIPDRLPDLEGIPADKRTPEQVARLGQRNQDARTAHKENATAIGRRLELSHTIWAASRMLAEAPFYMPHNLDFRGRIYAIPNGLNPQGSDLQKALLRFHKAVPIKTATDARWLAVHVANCFGIDKVSMVERERWVYANEAAILASAEDPMENTFWALKGDKKAKWCALAACFEWAGFRRVGYGFESTIAVAMDGSCNGIQNFSAMLLDEKGGRAVNLVPSDKPSDIYGIVAAEVQKLVDRDAFEGESETQYLAQGWSQGMVTRHVVKRNVMTMPYGSQQYGFGEQIHDDILMPWKRDAALGKVVAFPWKATFAPSRYLAKHVWAVVQEEVQAAALAMDWLRRAATKVSAEGFPVRWTTPMGLPVQQVYNKSTSEQFETTYGGTSLRIRIGVDEKDKDGMPVLDTKKQSSTLPPNFVHSLDASHMMRTVGAAAADDIEDFALIHDSYGTHAGNTQRLADHIRAEFVRMYSEADILANLKAELEAQSGLTLDALPPKGTLDLQQVLQSAYFFA
jgi:DNA-directed RNA polymerase